jgi:hypothetical protein
MVSGLASTPYGVAVGGTDFQNFGPNYNHNSPSPYWAATNDTHEASALGYVPEMVWNQNCTHPLFALLGYGSTPEAACNNPQMPARFIQTVASGGGKSGCTSSDQTNSSSCMGGYSKPSWQAAPGVPADGARDIPDVSLFSGAGFLDSAYIICESDELPSLQSCSLNTPYTTFLGVGGTSAAAPSFAGIMALVNQYTHSSGQGNANYVLYRLASSSVQTANACGATSGPSPACIFYDVTAGANTVPCWNGTYECTSTSGDSYGVLGGYNAGSGYDLAAGLGSVNAYNLVHGWSMPSNPSGATLSLTPTTLTHGQSVNYNVAVTPSAATGLVSLIGTPTGNGSEGMASFTLQNGSASGTTTALAGGKAYQVKAHYPGDSTYAASDSNPVIVTVTAEPSKPVIWIGNQSNPGFFTNPVSTTYGTSLIGYVGVGNAQATATLPPQPACAPLTCPTGTVAVSDSLNSGAPTVLTPAGGFPLNIEGISQTFTLQPPGGQHSIAANYAGDNSYLSGSGSYSLTVMPAGTYLDTGPAFTLSVGSTVMLSATVNGFVDSGFAAAAPTGTITFTDGGTPVPGTVTYTSNGGSSPNIVGSIPDTITTPGTHQITMSYSGDANYAAASSSTFNSVLYDTRTTENVTPITINDGQSVTVIAKATSAGKSPAMTGTFLFTGNPFFTPVTVVPTLGTDGSGNQVLTATTTITPPQFGSQVITANYSGDSNYQAGSSLGTVAVNPPDFTVGASAPSLTIVAGQTGTATVTLTPSTNLPSSVSLSCNPFPIVGGNCSFNPASPFTLANGSAVTTMLSITTLPATSNTTTSFVPSHPPQSKKISPGSWVLFVADGFAILILSLWSGRGHRRLAASVGMICLLLLAIGCSSGNSAGGGGGGPVPTTLTLSTTSTRVLSGGTVMMTATVNSSKPVTGTVTLSEPGLTLATAPLINGTAPIQLIGLPVGTHVITAQYSGDANNLPSQTNGSISEVITGTVTISLQASTGTLVHNTSLPVTIQ